MIFSDAETCVGPLKLLIKYIVSVTKYVSGAIDVMGTKSTVGLTWVDYIGEDFTTAYYS